MFPQVASGVRPFAAQGRVCSSSYNDPLNKTDPLGLRPQENAFERMMSALEQIRVDVERDCNAKHETHLSVTGIPIGSPPAVSNYDCKQQTFIKVVAKKLANVDLGHLPGDPNDFNRFLPNLPGATSFGNIDGVELRIEGNSGWREELVDDREPARHFASWFGYGFYFGRCCADRALKYRERPGQRGASERDIVMGEIAIDLAQSFGGDDWGSHSSDPSEPVPFGRLFAEMRARLADPSAPEFDPLESYPTVRGPL